MLGMPDIDEINIIKVSIHSIGTKQTGDSDNCCANKPTAQREVMKQETNRAEKCYTNTDSISKSNNKDKPTINNQLSYTVEYIISGPNYDSDEKKVLKSHSDYKGNTRHPIDVWHMHYKILLRRS